MNSCDLIKMPIGLPRILMCIGLALHGAAFSALPPVQEAYVKAARAQGQLFGEHVSISGETIVVSARWDNTDATGVNGTVTNTTASGTGAAYAFVRDGGAWKQQAYLKASNPGRGGFVGSQWQGGDDFGGAVDIDGDVIVIGATGEQSAATGVNGDQNDNSATNSGAAYIFVRNGTNWTQQAYLKASNTETRDIFGSSVAVSGDTVVVGAPREASNAHGINGNQLDNSSPLSGAVYVFVRTGTNWVQQAYLKASNCESNAWFGRYVSISGDTIVVGADQEDSGTVGVNGDGNDNSLTDSGAAYVFVRDGTNWSQQAYLKPLNPTMSDRFGASVSISGNTIAVGAPHFLDTNFTGSAYVFVRDGTNWTQQAFLKSPNPDGLDLFGSEVDVWNDTLVIGVSAEDSSSAGVNGDQTDNSLLGAGAAYVYVRGGTNWNQLAFLKASNPGYNDRFGLSVALSSNLVIAGAFFEDSGATGVNGGQNNESVMDSGAAYVFNLTPLPTLGIQSGVDGVVRLFWPLGASDFVVDETPALLPSSESLWSEIPPP